MRVRVCDVIYLVYHKQTVFFCHDWSNYFNDSYFGPVLAITGTCSCMCPLPFFHIKSALNHCFILTHSGCSTKHAPQAKKKLYFGANARLMSTQTELYWKRSTSFLHITSSQLLLGCCCLSLSITQKHDLTSYPILYVMHMSQALAFHI